MTEPVIETAGVEDWFSRVCRLMGLVVLVLVLACAFTPLPDLLAKRLETPRGLGRADAIVALGAGVQRDDTLNIASMRRAIHGILFRKERAPLLVFSGPDRSGRRFWFSRGRIGRTSIGVSRPEAEVRAELARDLGVPPEAILTDVQAKTTREEALRLGDRLRSRGVRKILLVTDPLHMGRAKPLFEREGFEVIPAPIPSSLSGSVRPESRLRVIRRLLKAAFGRVYYWAAGRI